MRYHRGMGRGQGKSRDPFASVFGSKRGAGRPNVVPKAHLWDDLDRIKGMNDSNLESTSKQGAFYMVQVGPVDKDGIPQGFGEFESKALTEARKICKRLQLKKFGTGEVVESDAYTAVLLDRGAAAEDVEELVGDRGLKWMLIIALNLKRERIDEYRDLVRRLSELAIPTGLVIEHGIGARQ